MKTITEYLDDAKAKFGSDYKVAAAINIDRAVYGKIRSRNAISDDNALKLADALGIEESEVLLAAAAARSKGRTKVVWEKVYRRVAKCLILLNFIYPWGITEVKNTSHNAYY